MPLIDSERVVQPVSEEAPAGPNLEYDADFAELERSVAGRPERQVGALIVPAEEADWSVVEKQATALLLRSKDLRVAYHLTRAWSRQHGWVGFAAGLKALQALLEAYWETVHPLLDRDEDNDPTLRVNAMAALADARLLLELRSAPLARSRTLGAISLRDFAVASGEIAQTAGQRMDLAMIDAAFQDAELQELEAVHDALQRAAAHVAAIDAIFEQRVGTGPNLVPLTKVVRQGVQVVSERLQTRNAASEGATETTSADGAALPAGPSRGSQRVGPLNSRDDVLRAIDKIQEYYANHEPSSPLPLLLSRCKRLVPMGFLDIMRDIAPDGLAQVEQVVGKPPESEP